VFPTVWRLFFTFVIPVAVMTTFPAMAMLGMLRPEQALGTLVGAIALLAVSRVIWRAALRSYTSASS
jgi:ABC-2 type transport system permease protein